jgi:hypothetical protein
MPLCVFFSLLPLPLRGCACVAAADEEASLLAVRAVGVAAETGKLDAAAAEEVEAGGALAFAFPVAEVRLGGACVFSRAAASEAVTAFLAPCEFLCFPLSCDALEVVLLAAEDFGAAFEAALLGALSCVGAVEDTAEEGVVCFLFELCAPRTPCRVALSCACAGVSGCDSTCACACASAAEAPAFCVGVRDSLCAKGLVSSSSSSSCFFSATFSPLAAFFFFSAGVLCREQKKRVSREQDVRWRAGKQRCYLAIEFCNDLTVRSLQCITLDLLPVHCARRGLLCMRLYLGTRLLCLGARFWGLRARFPFLWIRLCSLCARTWRCTLRTCKCLVLHGLARALCSRGRG